MKHLDSIEWTPPSTTGMRIIKTPETRPRPPAHPPAPPRHHAPPDPRFITTPLLWD